MAFWLTADWYMTSIDPTWLDIGVMIVFGAISLPIQCIPTSIVDQEVWRTSWASVLTTTVCVEISTLET
jgi:hypothetical protein